MSRSGYYKWLKDSDNPDKDIPGYEIIKEIFDAGKKKLGWRSIKMKLKNEKEIIMNHKKIMILAK